MFFDDRRKHGLRHDPFKALVAPRPIAWMSSVDADGVPNLAPFSYFNACADRPPTIVFAPNNPRPNGEGKDTLHDIEQTDEFVVNLAGYDLREAMNETSPHVGPAVDEFEPAGLTPAPSVRVEAPRIREAPASLECRFLTRRGGRHRRRGRRRAPASLECRFLTRLRLPSDHPELEDDLVIGQVVGAHIDDRIIRDGMVDMAAYRPIARLGYMDHTSVETVFEMPRPDRRREGGPPGAGIRRLYPTRPGIPIRAARPPSSNLERGRDSMEARRPRRKLVRRGRSGAGREPPVQAPARLSSSAAASASRAS